ncbi:2'-5' RNA ligase [Pseudochelatococcus lubricantis]|uniref:2'-5' RNA ligase n=2 Tax=Pseudochelatococcus lubricantis TaxID=1538102 RepID=A0ABX0UYU3_9HYPH|nr:2'-5' RNA ligase [Pseudochelatococcus lubricantis]
MCAQPVSRYAVYFAPEPADALWRFGSAVLGYDGATGEEVPQLVPEGFDAPSWRLLTADPRAYAFHATIKAPFRLAEGQTEESLAAALAAFSAGRQRFVLPPLQVTAIGDRQGGAFIALTESQPTPALEALERDTVEALEPFRAPLTDKEFAKRCPDALSERQLGYLKAYGYPHVFEDFRFHMTLTGRVPEAQVEKALNGLSALYGEHVGQARVPVEALALYRQTGSERFRVVARSPFA